MSGSIESVFPNPPAHYKQFKEEEDVKKTAPPPIPEVRPPLFGSSLSHLSTISTFEDDLDYLSVLKESLASFRSIFSRIIDTEEKVSEEEKKAIEDEHVGEALEDEAIERKKKQKLVVDAMQHAIAFYRRLSELREHEAREEVIQRMKDQLERHAALLESMKEANEALQSKIEEREGVS